MANKRIELEQYKHYVNLLEEEPNRKRVRKGFTVCVVVMMLLVIALFVLTVMSNTLATKPGNVLEKPQANPSLPTNQQIPSSVPGTQTIPSQVPGTQTVPVPSTSPGGKAPTTEVLSDSQVIGLPAGTRDGDLIAQATSPAPTTTVPVGTAPTTTLPSSSSSAGAPAKPKPNPGPGSQTTGAGNLSKLASGAGNRGLEIYALVIMLGLVVLLYLGMRRMRVEGKAK
jgi:hypothetical protein